jgi:beta-glucosidase
MKALVSAVLTLAGAVAVADDLVVLQDGAPAAGYVGLIGDKARWDTPVGAAPVTSDSGYLSMTVDNNEGLVQGAWNGKGEAQYFLAASEPQDLSGMLDQDAALVLVARVDEPPNKAVVLKMGCVYPCESSTDITRLLEALPGQQWIRVSFDLRCFADNGLDVTNVDVPLLVSTRGALGLSIADVRLVPGAGKDAIIRCR